MKIAVIGAGAMGCIFGGKLSREHEVRLIDTNAELVRRIAENGVLLDEEGRQNRYRPQSATSAEGLGEMDLVILFVKAMYSQAALAANRGLIGSHTYLMTLQNGAGHEQTLQAFAPIERVVIGTTEDNGAVLDLGHVRRGGKGRVNIGRLTKDADDILIRIKQALDCCGFDTLIHAQIQQLIWNKLLMNASLSATTGLLRCKLGYVGQNADAWEMAQALLTEGCAVARALGLEADPTTFTEKIRFTTANSPEGITSISADLQNGRKTEVDTITGAIVRAAQKAGISVPTHAFVQRTIHALEGLAK